jgi:choline dehydrogenase-like flavoprotein
MENTTTFTNLEMAYVATPPIECQDIPFRSDAYWECHIRQRAAVRSHSTGTCQMGKKNDVEAVLDSNLRSEREKNIIDGNISKMQIFDRVRGVGHLRVIDASVLPASGVNTNPNAAVMLVSEKISRQIIEEYA